MKAENIIQHSHPRSTYWGGSTPQWFQVDLGKNVRLLPSNDAGLKYRLIPSHYTLRHGYAVIMSSTYTLGSINRIVFFRIGNLRPAKTVKTGLCCTQEVDLPSERASIQQPFRLVSKNTKLFNSS